MTYATMAKADPIPPGAIGQNIEAVGYSNLNDKPGFKMSIQKVGGRWYLYLGMLWNEGLQIVDVTDPTEAIAEDCKEPLQQASIVDIADPAKPRLMAMFPLPLPPADWPIKSFCERGGRFGPHNRAYMCAIESELSDGRAYLQGNAPATGDFAVYHCVWFVSARVKEMDFLAGCPMLRAWRDRMAGFGQGTRTPLSPADALAIARESSPMPVAPSPYDDVGGCALGQEIEVAANDYGRDPVRGVLLSIDDNEIIIARRDPALGEVNVHFPRIGFDVMPAS